MTNKERDRQVQQVYRQNKGKIRKRKKVCNMTQKHFFNVQDDIEGKTVFVEDKESIPIFFI